MGDEAFPGASLRKGAWVARGGDRISFRSEHDCRCSNEPTMSFCTTVEVSRRIHLDRSQGPSFACSESVRSLALRLKSAYEDYLEGSRPIPCSEQQHDNMYGSVTTSSWSAQGVETHSLPEPWGTHVQTPLR